MTRRTKKTEGGAPTVPRARRLPTRLDQCIPGDVVEIEGHPCRIMWLWKSKILGTQSMRVDGVVARSWENNEERGERFNVYGPETPVRWVERNLD